MAPRRRAHAYPRAFALAATCMEYLQASECLQASEPRPGCSLLLPQLGALGLASGLHHPGSPLLLASCRVWPMGGRGERGGCISSLPQQHVSAGGCLPHSESQEHCLLPFLQQPQKHFSSLAPQGLAIPYPLPPLSFRHWERIPSPAENPEWKNQTRGREAALHPWGGPGAGVCLAHAKHSREAAARGTRHTELSG